MKDKRQFNVGDVLEYETSYLHIIVLIKEKELEERGEYIYKYVILKNIRGVDSENWFYSNSTFYNQCKYLMTYNKDNLHELTAELL